MQLKNWIFIPLMLKQKDVNDDFRLKTTLIYKKYNECFLFNC